jgi:hypothetical protein
MLATRTAVGQDVGVVATCVFQGVGQDRHQVEGSLIVDRLGEGNDRRSEPSAVESDGAEAIAEDFPKEIGLRSALRSINLLLPRPPALIPKPTSGVPGFAASPENQAGPLRSWDSCIGFVYQQFAMSPFPITVCVLTGAESARSDDETPKLAPAEHEEPEIG